MGYGFCPVVRFLAYAKLWIFIRINLRGVLVGKPWNRNIRNEVASAVDGVPELVSLTEKTYHFTFNNSRDDSQCSKGQIVFQTSNLLMTYSK